MDLFEFKKVTLKYHYDKTEVLKDFDFCVKEGETVTLMLEVQSGKSSVAKLLTGVIKPTFGEIFFKGQNYASAPRDKGIMYIGEEPLYFKNKSVYFNLSYPLKIRKYNKEEVRQIIEKINARYNLDLNKKARALTQEEMGGFLCARGETRPLNLVILDSVRNEYFENLCALATEKNCALLILTSDIAQTLGRVLIMQNNQIIYEGAANSAKETLQNILWLT